MKYNILILFFLILLFSSYSLSNIPENKYIPKDLSSSQKNENKISTNKYLRAVQLGSAWFLKNQTKDFIYYSYSPYKDEHPDKHHALREAGALWSIGYSANYLQHSDLANLAQKGFSYFEKNFKKDEDNNFIYVNITPTKIKLGYSAFMILTLLEIDNMKKNYYLEQFANSILYHQQENGKLQTFFYSERDTGNDYYPGEALFALMSLYNVKKDISYLEAVKKAFPYYKDYWDNNKNTAFVPWQSRAYTMLYNITEDIKHSDFVFEMNDYMLQQHSPKTECANFNFSRGIVTSVYTEGVIQAYTIAKKLNEEKAQCYKNFITEAIDYIITLQLKENIALPSAAIGGFLGGENSSSMQVDRNQHSITAIMDACNAEIINCKD